MTLLAYGVPRRALLTVSATGPFGQSLPGARVAVDGQVKCATFPCSVSGLGAGDHTVRVTTDEYGSAEQVVAMRWGLDHSVRFSLAAPCRDAASGTPAAQGSVAEPPQEHGRAAEAESVSSAARVQPDKLRPLRFGTIKANSIPVSRVLVDGRFVGETPVRTKSVPGQHTVSFVHSEYGRKDVAVQVKPDEDAVVSVQLERDEP